MGGVLERRSKRALQGQDGVCSAPPSTALQHRHVAGFEAMQLLSSFAGVAPGGAAYRPKIYKSRVSSRSSSFKGRLIALTQSGFFIRELTATSVTA